VSIILLTVLDYLEVIDLTAFELLYVVGGWIQGNIYRLVLLKRGYMHPQDERVLTRFYPTYPIINPAGSLFIEFRS
jgi:hypothetical protein